MPPSDPAAGAARPAAGAARPAAGGDEVLHGGVNTVRRRGEAVHRPASAASATIQRLLRHVRQQGFTGAPEPLGFDAEGNEVVSYLAGTVHPALPAGLRTRRLLASAAARLVALLDFIRTRATAGDPAFQRHVADGHPALYEGDLRYLAAGRPTFLRTFTAEAPR